MNKTPLAILIAVAFATMPLVGSVAAAPDSERSAPPTPPGLQQYLVGFFDAPALDTGDGYANGRVQQAIPELRLAVVSTPDAARFVAQARDDPNVRYVEWDDPRYARPVLTPDDALYGDAGHWGSKRIGGEAAWDVTTGATSVKVAMVDSGINRDHEEFTGQSRLLQGYDFAQEDSDPEDTRYCGYHGTHTTGTAGATISNGKGIAGMSQHTILPVKIFHGENPGPWGCSSSVSTIVNAIKYTGDQGVDISSNSWGGGGSSTAINDAIAYAHGKGVIHVAAAGNSGSCTDCVSYPWKDNPDKVIIVSALDTDDTMASFSSQGPEVDVIAPGVDILSSTGGSSDYAKYDGTSMAAPHVAGALALYVAATGSSDYATVDGALKSTAEDLGLDASRQGAGLVRADALVGASSGGATNSAPTASFTYACTDLSCDFDASASSDTDGTISSYAWDFGDGTTGSGALVSHTFGASGDYTVTLVVTDDGGATDSESQVVSVSDGASGGGITLDATGYKVKGRHHADLAWSGATSTDVDVYVDDAYHTTTHNDGAYTWSSNYVGGGSHSFQVCEAGTTTCSNVATASY